MLEVIYLYSLEAISEKLKVLSDPTRLTILAYLKKEELCVCQLVEVLNISQPAVSQQLKRLKKEEIILERRQGTWAYYRLNPVQESYVEHILECLPDVGDVEFISCPL